ncbi:elongator complex protein 6 [Leptinotarsa decemlineata]|uniref:elongator complex protein 6 n=1 Tax=Leptinotarsa decemlineata TaxID=7539 RepID=UPI000C255267|nr:elongator complex protein 6 [Leptinotarsa decemlineata]
MISLGDPRTSNPVLSALQIRFSDRIIAVRENSTADSNFIITHLIKQILYEKNRLCLVSFHNTFEHYQNVGKKLGYDLLKAVQDGDMRIIEPMNDIVDDIGLEERYFQDDKENIVKCLYFDIKKNLDEMTENSGKQAYLIVDDVSHLHDLGIENSQIVNFVNYLVNLISNENISVILNNHVASKYDEIISNNMEYVADVHIEVSALKTGKSQDVTGLLTVKTRSNKNHFQFKAFDRGIKTFHPGESLHFLYK